MEAASVIVLLVVSKGGGRGLLVIIIGDFNEWWHIVVGVTVVGRLPWEVRVVAKKVVGAGESLDLGDIPLGGEMVGEMVMD